MGAGIEGVFNEVYAYKNKVENYKLQLINRFYERCDYYDLSDGEEENAYGDERKKEKYVKCELDNSTSIRKKLRNLGY